MTHTRRLGHLLLYQGILANRNILLVSLSSKQHPILTSHCMVMTSDHFHTSCAKSSNQGQQDVFHNQPKSWLFVSDSVAGAYGSQVNLSLNLKARLAGQQLQNLVLNCKARKMDHDLPQLCSDYEVLQQLEHKRSEIEKRKKNINSKFSQLKGLEKTAETESKVSLLHEERAAAKRDLVDLQNQLWPLEERVMHAALKLPNDLHNKTPLEETSKVLNEKQYEKDLADHTKSHVEIARKFGLIKFSNVGPKAYFLHEHLATAERLLCDTLCDSLQGQGYRLMAGPEFFKSPVLEGCGRDFWDPREVLTLQHVSPIVEPMSHLAGVSPMTFVAYVARMCISDKILPLRMLCAGRAYTNSTLPGLFGAVQSTQVGMFSCTSESQVETEFEAMSELIWTHLASLGFSLRVCQQGASQLRCEEKRRLEFEMFSPHLKKYLPVGHVSDLGDYVSQRLMTCHNLNHADFKLARPVHMVSGTALNITSLLALWMEHSDYTKDSFQLCPLPGLQIS